MLRFLITSKQLCITRHYFSSAMDSDYEIIPRSTDQSLKYYNQKRVNSTLDMSKALIVSIADMQYKFSPQIYKKFIEKVQNPHFGYPKATPQFWNVLQNWIRLRYYSKAQVNEMTTNLWNGTSSACSFIIESLTKSDDEILIMTPTYSFFLRLLKEKERKIVEFVLDTKQNRFYIDFEKLEETIKTHQIKLFLFINPWNPCGRIWSKQQLKKLANLTFKYKFYFLSDEIYADSIQPTEQQQKQGLSVQNLFTSMLAFEQIHPYLIYASSYTKAFNCSGVPLSYSICFNKELQSKIYKYKVNFGVLPNQMSLAMLEVIYKTQQARQWKLNTNKYIMRNYKEFKELCAEKLPDLQIYDLECSYLMMVDFKKYNLAGAKLREKFIKVNLCPTFMQNCFFAEKERSVVRINLAINRELIKQIVNRMEQVINQTKNQIK